MRRLKAFLAVMTAVLLTACGNNGSNEVTEANVSVTESMEATEEQSLSETTEAEIPETTEAEAPETSEETTAPETTEAAEPEEDTEEDADIEKPVIVSSDEVYEVYPVRLIYPEMDELPMEKASFSDQVCSEGGKVLFDFSAEYPVFTLYDKTVTDKINKAIKDYVMGVYEKGKKAVEEDPDLDPDDADLFGFIFKDTIRFDDPSSVWDFYDYSVNGDLLSVYFEYESYGAGAAHGSYSPINLVFDMKTGDAVDLSSIIGDMDGFSKAVMKGIFLYYSGGSTEEYEECINDENNIDYIKKADMTYIIAVRDGAVGYYLYPYEYGSFADGIRCIRIPISEALTYFTDEGRELFDGTVSAEAVPAKVIEYGGKKYLDIGNPPEFTDKELTAEDYELMSLFPEAKSFRFTNCSNIDFEKITAMKNIRMLFFYDCEFDDISPLFGSNIDYIKGIGYNISKEQAEEFKKAGGSVGDGLLKEFKE